MCVLVYGKNDLTKVYIKNLARLKDLKIILLDYQND